VLAELTRHNTALVKQRVAVKAELHQLVALMHDVQALCIETFAARADCAYIVDRRLRALQRAREHVMEEQTLALKMVQHLRVSIFFSSSFVFIPHLLLIRFFMS
jgi:hypothetical protein